MITRYTFALLCATSLKVVFTSPILFTTESDREEGILIGRPAFVFSTGQRVLVKRSTVNV